MLKLETVHRELPTFNLVGYQGGKKDTAFLKCSFFSDDATRHIAVKVLEVNDDSSERQPLTGRATSKWSCGCWPSRWLTVEVVVNGNKTALSVDVKDISKKWQLDEKIVRDKCGENAFDQLAMQAVLHLPADPKPASGHQYRSPSGEWDGDFQQVTESAESSVADPDENKGGPPAVRIRQVRRRESRRQVSNNDGPQSDHSSSAENDRLKGQEPSTEDDSSSYGTLVTNSGVPDDEELAVNPQYAMLIKNGTLATLVRKGSKTTLSQRRVVVQEPVPDGKEDNQAQESIFDKFPFGQLKVYLGTVAGESESIKLVRLLQKEWKGISALIEAKKASWRSSCESNGAANMIIRPNPHSSLHVEYFFLDDSVWIHFNCNQTALALDLSTGVLCRRRAITKEQAEKLTQIQRLAHRCPFIDYHMVSAFKGGSVGRGIMVKGLKKAMPVTSVEQKDMFRLMTPFFGTNMTDALESKLIRKETRDEFALQWLLGLDALHAADIAHFAIGPEALLIQTDPRSGQIKAVIGGFSRVFFISNPPEKIAVADDFHKAMPPECREKNGSIPVPKNAKAVDIYQLATCLKDIYADLFDNSAPMQPSKMVFTDQSRSANIRYIIEQMLDADPNLLRISADKAVARWKMLPEK